jgi:hypothetical protein
MKTVGLFILFLIAWVPSALCATLHLEVETDKAVYYPGQTISWSLYAWTDPAGNRGISLLSVHLDDDTGEALNPPDNSGSEFTDTEYGAAENFIVAGPGTIAGSSSRLRDILAFQSPAAKTLDIGNDGVQHVYCKGSYTATALGTHTLTAIYNSANYWPDPTNNAVAFEANDSIPAVFEVLSEPTFCGDINTVYLNADIAMPQDCYVDFSDFATLSSQWMSVGCASPGWCDGADINESTGVDETDLGLFSDQWLWCSDPGNSACDIYWK